MLCVFFWGGGAGALGMEKAINLLSGGKMLRKNFLKPAKYCDDMACFQVPSPLVSSLHRSPRLSPSPAPLLARSLSLALFPLLQVHLIDGLSVAQGPNYALAKVTHHTPR